MAARSSPSPRSRPGRGARAGTRQGAAARHQAENIFIEDLREEFVRDYVFRCSRQRRVRGPVPARHLDRAALDRQEADRDRGGDRRRRRVARRHRQGQRPGALRARLLRAEAGHHHHRAVARMGHALARAAHRLRRGAPDPDREGQARRGAVLGGREPPALVLRGQGAGGPGAGRAGLRLFAHRRPADRAGQTDRLHHRFRGRAIRSPSTARSCRRPRCSPGSTTSAATTASAGSTSSRTASSA